MMENVNEPLLEQSNKHFSLFLIQYNDLWNLCKKAEASFWTAEEIDLREDVHQWTNLLNQQECHFISRMLAFFATADGIVNENLAQQFQVTEARSFYGFQMAMENIHSEVYSLLLDSLVKDVTEQKNLFNAIETIPSIKHKAEWALRWCSASADFAQHVIAFMHGLMPGLTFSNKLISWDEGLHTKFACTLYGHLHHKPSNTTVTEVISEVVSLEEDINTLLMCQYVRYIVDQMLGTLHCDKIYHVNNPFDFMDMISMEGKMIFLEKRVSDYSRRIDCELLCWMWAFLITQIVLWP
ncbi:beta subunit of ribonucleoside-diphosphate reductase [Suillus subluteus]|nr:beta subunit of ribonucleoside-diphosphate reductase [Suillus subluteus]